jgi:hypothetical protein
MTETKCETQVAMVLVTKAYIDKMERRSKLLAALEAGGVDNWEQYHEATKEFYREELGEDEDD